MTADPYELENRIWTADPLFVRRLEAWMGSFRTCSGDGCRDLEIRPAPFGCDVVAEFLKRSARHWWRFTTAPAALAGCSATVGW